VHIILKCSFTPHTDRGWKGFASLEGEKKKERKEKPQTLPNQSYRGMFYY